MGFFDSILRKAEQQRVATADNFPLGRGGVMGLRDILQKYFLPELESARKQRGPIEDAFNQQSLTPGALYGAASTAAMGKANELFAPGGEVASMISRARGKSIQSGFNPGDAYGDESAILRGATKSVGDAFAQSAAGLESARYSGLASAYGKNDVTDLIESLFTGVGSSEQLALAKKAQQSKFLGIF